jgi:transcriptional regulator with XRE-family HTH domain
MSTARAVRLGLGLRKIRHGLGWSLEQASEEVGLAKSTISRYETAELVPAPGIVRSLLVAYGTVNKSELEPWIKLAREATRAEDDWWLIYRYVLPDHYLHYVALEADADEIRTGEPSLIPGILQTQEYAWQIMKTGPKDLSAEEMEQRVEARLQRQARLLTAEAPRLHAVIDESALRRPEADLCRKQCEHLREVAHLPTITLQIMPLSVGLYPGYGQVTLFTYDDLGQTFAATDTAIGDMVFHRPEDVAAFQEVFDRLATLALPASESLTRLEAIMSSL